MRINFRVLSTALSVAVLIGSAGLSTTATAADKSVLEEGKKIAMDIKLGNCIACHIMGDGEQPGNIAPPLIAMKARFPDKAVLRAQIADARAKNPDTIMPPFETHGIMTPEQVDKVTEYILSL